MDKPRLPDISTLNLHDHGPPYVEVPADIEHATDSDPAMERLRTYVKSLPYSVEPNSHMQALLDFILARLVQCVQAKDFDPGFLQWDSMLTYWSMLKYPIPKAKRVALIKMYYEVAVLPGMPANIMTIAAEALNYLSRSKNKLSVVDIRLPWKPIYKLISNELFLSKRKFEINQLPAYMGYIADSVRRFFHPAAIDEMLETFLPHINGTNLNTVLASEYYLLTFLPLTHPQTYLPMLFRMWESMNTYNYDERMLYFLAQLAELHVDPSVSDPAKVEELPDDARSEDEGRPNWPKDDLKHEGPWNGIQKDVGIFTEEEWSWIMVKCLASMEIPLADTGSLTTGPSVDNQASFEIGRLRKSTWRIFSLARIIVYSMAPDGTPLPPSGISTPFTPGFMTPDVGNNNLGDYLSSPLGAKPRAKIRMYLAGSKALDSLAKLIVSTESFFHPNNSGTWTADLSAFVKYLVYEFNKRWHEEQQPECRTPMHRRLTSEMKRELVKCLRTVTLLAMFSRDATTVSNIQSCLKSMTVMEPDLILHPVLERAIPSLEALVETQRTTAVIKALGAVALALVSRDIYYPGAKHIIQILDLLIPGIDLNDPSKTLCTTAFLVEISQYIKFGDLTTAENEPKTATDTESPEESRQMGFETPSETGPTVMFIDTNDTTDPGRDRELTNAEEDALLRESTADFADWISNFIRRVILLLENLPEEGTDGTLRGGESEVQVIDAVAGACSQICVHLSDPLFDLVLNMVFDYASTNVRSNAVRAIHQLVECMANSDPAKTLAKFMPYCTRNIRVELEHGASSLRTTTTKNPLPSDATLHWNLAILRGAMHNDGKAVLKYRAELLDLLRVLRDKTFSKRGYSWSGKLLSSVLLTLTHTYPLENKFVNPDEWASKEFRGNHHRYWGKLYKPEEIQMSWHIPSADEIDFVLSLFHQLVEPTLGMLEELLNTPPESRDSAWRNDFCRYLTVVRNGFAGTPTLVQEYYTAEQLKESCETSDILNELPEMIGHVDALKSCFVLTDPTDPRHKYLTGLRRRFGIFLRKASSSLRQQGEENTIDAVHILIRAIRTFALEYGDSRDSYYSQSDQYSSEIGLSRQYAKQKVWPRAVLVRRIRRYHAARLRWNSIERLRGELEDSLIDELVEWSMWHYATVRESAQSLLNSFTSTFDGVRRRCVSQFMKYIAPGGNEDRIKGALYSLNMPIFTKYAISEPVFRIDLLRGVFGCQSHTEPSLQDCAGALIDNCLSSIFEPNVIVYSVDSTNMDRAAKNLETLLAQDSCDDKLALRCTQKRVLRTSIYNKTVKLTGDTVLAIAKSSSTHWRYAIIALRILRTLIRRDEPINAEQTKYFLEMAHDSHPSIRYYAQRAVMKSLRYVKLRTFSKSPEDIAMERNHNPLRVRFELKNLNNEFNARYLEGFKQKLNTEKAFLEPILQDKANVGWLAWPEHVELYLAAPPGKSCFKPWEPASQEMVAAVREVVLNEKFWKSLSGRFAEENHATVITQDNISCVKSIFQILEEEPFEYLRPTLEILINDVDQNKQRAAADLIAGILGGSKHWPSDAQERLWTWFTPFLGKILGSNVKTDTMFMWTSFLEYVFSSRDPRRIQPLVDYITENFKNCDFNGELSFDAVKIASFTRAFYEEMGWKSFAWMDEILDRYWLELNSEHDEVRAYISDALEYFGKAKWQPNPSIPRPEVFVRDCRVVPIEYDIMGIRGTHLSGRVQDLVENFKAWKEERIPGTRAFQSMYDRVGVIVCKWLYQAVHDIQASSVFDYILPLMPELFRFSEVSDNDDLSRRASNLLVRMCGVVPPRPLINPIIESIFVAIKSSPSWRVRLKALPLLQIFYFRQVPLIKEAKVLEILEIICRCLDDENVEVREMAATTLSGILRISPRHSVITLKDRFVRLVRVHELPARQAPGYAAALRKRHAAILGVCALVDSFPYTVEKWMPALLADVLAEHTYDPTPVSTAVHQCASRFKKTHQDTWHEDAKRFNDEQLSALSTLLTGSSYYA
ncbi:ARM repeat-containing protein [Phellopilus nigrolimitatus]|nr:ARM repeat-containing protein [Phellopilus nigrolimitatus]